MVKAGKSEDKRFEAHQMSCADIKQAAWRLQGYSEFRQLNSFHLQVTAHILILLIDLRLSLFICPIKLKYIYFQRRSLQHNTHSSQNGQASLESRFPACSSSQDPAEYRACCNPRENVRVCQ